MSRREHTLALIPELMFVEAARKRAKLSQADAVRRVSDAVDWEAVDNAGNNLGAVINAIRAAVKRAI